MIENPIPIGIFTIVPREGSYKEVILYHSVVYNSSKGQIWPCSGVPAGRPTYSKFKKPVKSCVFSRYITKT
jgi:hypothetical protein